MNVRSAPRGALARFATKIRRAFACLVLAASVPASANDAPDAFKIIANPAVPGRTITRDILAQIYLGKVQRWGDGRNIAAVDLSSTAPLRAAFSTAVLAMPVEAVRRRWLELLPSGKRPPITKASEQDVIAYVAGEAGGIGYVGEATVVPPTVRVLQVR